MIRVLITSASRKVWLIKAFQRALSEEGGGEVMAVDSDPKSAALYVADKGYLVPLGLGEDFLRAILGICQKHAVKLVVPTRDEELSVLAAAKPRLQDIHVTVMASDPDVIEVCQDKRLFVEFCLENGFSVPKTYKAADIETISEFPIFVKERFGKGSKRTFVAESRKDLAYLLGRLKDPIIQEYINAMEYTVDLFADFSGEVISVVPRERLSVFGGETFVGRTRKNWEIIRASICLARRLKLKGHNTIQCFLHHGVVKLIEVNPRYGGGANLSFSAGAFTPLYLIRLLQGKPLKPAIGEFEEGCTMLRYTQDIFTREPEMSQVERLS